MMFVLTASSTTELRPVRSASDLSSWSVDDVARYIADADSALTPYSELFRKHVCTIVVFCITFISIRWSACG